MLIWASDTESGTLKVERSETRKEGKKMGGPFPDVDIGGIGNMIGAGADLLGAGLNYSAQMQNLDYQKALQKQVFQREDTSIQRRVADLRAAGLSPVLAAGQGAQSGAVVSTQAPQLNLNAQDRVLKMFEGQNMAMALAKQKADISKTEAETEAIRAQTPIQTATMQEALEHMRNMNPNLVKEIENKLSEQDLEIVRKEIVNKMLAFDQSKQETLFERERAKAGDASIMRSYEKDTAEQHKKAQTAIAELSQLSVDFWKKVGIPQDGAHAVMELIKTLAGANQSIQQNVIQTLMFSSKGGKLR